MYEWEFDRWIHTWLTRYIHNRVGVKNVPNFSKNVFNIFSEIYCFGCSLPWNHYLSENVKNLLCNFWIDFIEKNIIVKDSRKERMYLQPNMYKSITFPFKWLIPPVTWNSMESKLSTTEQYTNGNGPHCQHQTILVKNFFLFIFFFREEIMAFPSISGILQMGFFCLCSQTFFWLFFFSCIVEVQMYKGFLIN